jgi:hypothetical protein
MSDKTYVETSLAGQIEEGVEMDDLLVSELKGTSADEHEMRMLGKTQQLSVSSTKHNFRIPWQRLTDSQRNFRFISTLGFACTLMSTWEISLM